MDASGARRSPRDARNEVVVLAALAAAGAAAYCGSGVSRELLRAAGGAARAPTSEYRCRHGAYRALIAAPMSQVLIVESARECKRATR